MSAPGAERGERIIGSVVDWSSDYERGDMGIGVLGGHLEALEQSSSAVI